MKNLRKGIKKGFTLVELAVVIATTAVLMAGFTSFSIFFNRAYQNEQRIDSTFNSALDLKNKLSNNIEKYNYLFESSEDFVYGVDGKVDLNKLFVSTSDLIEENNIKKSVERTYYFKDLEVKKGSGKIHSVFGFKEVLTETNTVSHVVTTSESSEVVYKCLTPMRLSITHNKKRSIDNLKRVYDFNIEFDFENDDKSDSNNHGKQNLSFSKYIYFKN